MKKEENQHFNQCSHEITHKIKRKKIITDRPTLVFLAMFAETFLWPHLVSNMSRPQEGVSTKVQHHSHLASTLGQNKN